MKILLPPELGFCFGVKRAVEMAEESLKKDKKVFSLGWLIHNPRVVEELEKKGVKTVNSLSRIKEGTLIIRSHGAPLSLIEEAKKRGLKIVDATCPYVRKVQNLAKKLEKDSYQVVIIGSPEHPEVKGVLSGLRKEGKVVASPEEAKKIGGSPGYSYLFKSFKFFLFKFLRFFDKVSLFPFFLAEFKKFTRIGGVFTSHHHHKFCFPGNP